MVSIESVKNELAEQQGRILVLMQEGDGRSGFLNAEWADEMYSAYEHVRDAIKCLNKAEDYE